MARVISIGEVMVQLNPVSSGPLRNVRMFERHIAGSEANILVGLERLGIRTRLISRVGDDELGLAILAELRAGGVDVSTVKTDACAPTGIYFVQRGYPVPGKTIVFYYRKGSAASRMDPSDVNEEAVRDSELVLITGITPALSETCYEASRSLLSLARSLGIPVVFDTNVRVKLWQTGQKALTGLRPFFAGARYVFTGQGDLDFLFGPGELESQVAQVYKVAPEAEFVVVKQGKDGASVYRAGEDVLRHSGYKVEVVDELGAGDAFVAAFLACLLLGRDLNTALVYANAAGALAVTVKGDLEPLPTWGDLNLFIQRYGGSETTLLR